MRKLDNTVRVSRWTLLAAALVVSVGACDSAVQPDPDAVDVLPDFIFDTGGDGGGGGSSATPTLGWVVTRNEGTISTFVVDDDTGILTYNGYHTVSDVFAFANVRLHPSGDFLYGVAENRVFGFDIDEQTGALMAINDLPGDDFGLQAMVFNEAGTVVYVANRTTDTILEYGIDPSTGMLSSLGSVTTGENPVDLEIHPSGELLYAVNRDDGEVSVFPIESDGSLGTQSPAYSDPSFNLTAIAFTPAGDYAYVTLAGDDRNVLHFSVNTATGTLNVANTFSADSRPIDIVVDATGATAYTANSGNANLTVFSIAAGSGELTFEQQISAGNDPYTIHFGLGGETLYVGNLNSSEVSIYAIAADGGLSAIDDVRTRSGVLGMAFRAGEGTVAHESERLYVPHPENAEVVIFDIESEDGSLVEADTTVAGERPTNVAFHPSGEFAYVVNGDTFDIHAFSVDTETGLLTPNGVNSIGGFEAMLLTRLAVDPSGRFLYALDNRDGIGNPGRIFMYDINANGTLTYNTEVNGPDGIHSGGENPENLIIHPSGRYMYVMNSYGDNVTLFEIAETTGGLSQRERFSTLDRPLHASIHPNGRWIYITVQNEFALHKYYMRDDNGSLTSLQRLVQQSEPPAETSHVVVHPSGDFAYLTARDDTISWYSVDRANGGLTYVDMLEVPEGPEWLSLTPDGRFAYGVSTNGVQRFSIDATTGAISHDGLTDLTSLGTFQRSLTLDSIRQ